MAGFDVAARQFGQRIVKLSKAVEAGERQTLMSAGLAGKAEHVDLIRRHTGDMKLSGVGKRGAKVGARFDIKDDSVRFSATGPLHFVANPMSPHRIPKQRGARARRRYVVLGPDKVFSSANHPGTRGKNTWWKAAPDARQKVGREIHKKQTNIVRKAFG